MPGIRTVLGDIAAEEAGVTLTHEHIRYAYQGCEFDHNSVWDLGRYRPPVTSTPPIRSPCIAPSAPPSVGARGYRASER